MTPDHDKFISRIQSSRLTTTTMVGNGYVRIPQQEDGSATDTEDEAGESPSAHHMRSYSTGSTATSSSSRPRHQRTTSRTSIGKIDLSSLDNAFKRWTQEITQKVRRKKKAVESEAPKEIVFSVFQRVPPKEGPPQAPVSLYFRTLCWLAYDSAYARPRRRLTMSRQSPNTTSTTWPTL